MIAARSDTLRGTTMTRKRKPRITPKDIQAAQMTLDQQSQRLAKIVQRMEAAQIDEIDVEGGGAGDRGLKLLGQYVLKLEYAIGRAEIGLS
jgi:hypothetical protein